MKKIISSLFVLMGMQLHLIAFANIKLPAIFSDGMVLQQNAKAAIWGWASPNETISISTTWSKQTLTTRPDTSGKWRVNLQTPAAGGPYTITIKGVSTIELKDVLIGEVWLCSGQSNMGMTLKASQGGKEEMAKADYPTLRYFSLKRQYGTKEFNDCPGSVWVKSTPATSGGFSAVAFYFAKEIQEHKNVPIGIIFNAWGGTPAEAWTPADVLNDDSVLQQYINRWDDIRQHVGKDSTAYHIALSTWEKAKNTADSNTIKKPSEPQTLYYFNRPWRKPSVLFNGLVNPVIPFTIKGVLWYQGESNVGYADEYELLFSKMINSWRHRWANAGGQKDIPFIFVQLPPYGYSDLYAAAVVRQAQENVSKKLKNTAIVVSMDVGNMNDIHPTKKREVGERLAAIALNKLYGNKKLDYKNAKIKSVKPIDNKIKVEFDDEIVNRQAGGFEIGYYENNSLVYLPAKARVSSKVITIWNDKVLKPVAVRYGWLEIAGADLIGKNGLPVAPFAYILK